MKRSVSVVPSIAAKVYNEPSHESSSCHMLRDDLSLGIMPFYNLDEYVLFHVNQGEDRSVRRAVSSAFGREDRSARLAENLAEFVRSAARTAVFYGDAHYEVVLDGFEQRRSSTRDGVEDGLRFRVESILPLTVYRSLTQIVQRIPAEDSASHRQETIVLDSTRTFEVALPGISRDRWLRLLDGLVEVDRSWLRGDLPFNQGFDPSVQQRLVQQSQLYITGSIPWVRAGRIPKELSEIYLVHRWLRMQRFVYVLRASIIAAMNDMLAIAGVAKGFHAQIEITGLPTCGDVDAAIEQLLAGTVGPEVIDAFIRSTR